MAKKIRPTTTNTTVFSEDITTQIFSWLPIKSLMRFKCLSKNFDSLVSESYFVDIHQHHSMSTCFDEIKFFVPESEGFYSIEIKKYGKASRYKFDFRYDDLSYHNGLICFWVRNIESVRIFNPGTKEIRVLPPVRQLNPLRYLGKSYLSSYFGCSYILGYESEEKKYKVLMTLRVTSTTTRNWIFTLGRDKSWREIRRINYSPRKKEICICGVIYILDCSNTFVVAFNLKAENFKFIRLWEGSDFWNCNYVLKEVEGKLGIFDCSSEDVNLRILVNPKKAEWQSHNIRFPSHVKNIGAYKICSCCDGEILVFVIRLNVSVKVRSCYCYHVRKNTWKYLRIPSFSIDEDSVYRCDDDGIYTYVESLFPTNLKNPSVMATSAPGDLAV